jgi:hypothetical protein
LKFLHNLNTVPRAPKPSKNQFSKKVTCVVLRKNGSNVGSNVLATFLSNITLVSDTLLAEKMVNGMTFSSSKGKDNQATKN